MKLSLPYLAFLTLLATLAGLSVCQAAPPAATGTGWELVYDDEFNGTSVDTVKWNVASPGWTMPNSLSTASASKVSVANDVLTLSATRSGSTNAFSSGSVSTYNKYTWDGGYFEARIALPTTPGSWPAFWGLYTGWPPEADIMEFPLTTDGGTNGYPNTKYHTAFHYTNSSGSAASGAGKVDPSSAGALNISGTTYHTFGMHWVSDTSVTFYFDGAQVSSFNNAAVAQMAAMYLILDYAVGGWPGTPSLAQWPAGFSDQTKVDWVRVWQKRPSGSSTVSTWKINGGGSWTTAGNWTGLVPQYSGQQAIFPTVGNAASANVTWSNSVTVGGITFSGAATTPAYSLSGTALQLAGSGGTANAYIEALASSQANQTINARMELANATEFRNNMTGGQLIVLNGQIIGGGDLILNGAGTVLFSNNNAYTGNTSIGSGQGPAVARVTRSQPFGTTGTVTIGPAGNATTARIEIQDGRTVPNAINFGGRSNASVGIENLSGTNTFSGTISAQSGGANYLIQSDAGLLQLTGATTGVALNAGATGARTFTLQGAGDGIVSGIIANGNGTVSITKSGTGTWTLGGANTYTGLTTINAGTLALGAANRIADTLNMTLGGGTFATGGFSETVGTLSMAENSTIDLGNSASTLAYSGAGTFTGGKTLTIANWTQGSDHLFIGSSQLLTGAQLAQINFNGTAAQQFSSGEVAPVGAAQTYHWKGDVDANWSTNNAGNTNWAVDATGTTDAGALPDANTDAIFAATGASNVANTVLGADFSIKGLTVNSPTAVGIGGTNHLTLGADGLSVASGAGATTINTSGQVILGTNQGWSNASANALTVSSAVTGSGFGLTKVGTGTLVLTGTNTYSGGTTINEGTLQLGSGGTTGSIAGNVADNGTLIVNRADAVALGGMISGTGSVTTQGAGTLTLSNTNTYSGGTTIGANQGAAVLRVTAHNALGTGNVALDPTGNASTARLDLSGGISLGNPIDFAGRNNASVGLQNLSGSNTLSGLITLGSGGATYIVQSDAGLLALSNTGTSTINSSKMLTLQGTGNGSMAGLLAGAGGVTKAGAGTWVLSGANAYTGTTTVNGGTLAIAAAERIADASNLTLGGGIFATGGFSETLGTLSLADNSTLDLGSGASTLTYSGIGSFTSAKTLAVTNWTAGSDHLFIGSTASLTAAQLAQINFDGNPAKQLATGEVVPAVVKPEGITVTPTSGLTTTEAGGTATFTVVLKTMPTKDVTIDLSSSDTTEGTVAPASLTFTSANWDTAQTVTVTGVDDLVADGDVAYTIVTAPAVSGDANYKDINAADVAVTNTDDEATGFTVTPTAGLTTTEAGVTATFTVKLKSQPTADVTVGLSSSDTTEGTVAPASLTFTNGNWDTAQTVTVTGVDDLVADGDVAYTIVTAPAVSNDNSYKDLDATDVAVTNTDDDTAGITVTPTAGLTTTEAGGTATFTVQLDSQPTADVTIGLSSSDTTEGTVAPASLKFTNANWSVAQTVTITGANDALIDGAIAYAIFTAPATSTDTSYKDFNPSDVGVTNTDNDVPSITVTPTTGLTTTEAGGTATFTVKLDTQPSADVTIGLSSSDATEGTVSPGSLTFTSANWNVAQTVTVKGVNDVLDDGDIAYTIVTAPASSTDTGYNGFNVPNVAVTNLDDDAPPAGSITVSPTSGLVTTENGGTATFTVVLGNVPTANVTIGLKSSKTAEGTVSPASLTFTPFNWHVSQIVTVKGVNDALADGNVAYSIITAPSVSADYNYNGLNPPDVAVTNMDGYAGPFVAMAITSPTSPQSGITVFPAIKGTASDPSGIKDVKFTLQRVTTNQFWNGVAWGPMQTWLPATFNAGAWQNSGPLPGGANLGEDRYVIVATSTNQAGGQASATRNVVVNAAAPSIAINEPVSPQKGVTVFPLIKGTASDSGFYPSGVKEISFTLKRIGTGQFWNGTAWGTAQTALPTTFNGTYWQSSGALPGGSKLAGDIYRIVATASDRAGNQASATRDVTVMPSSPSQ